MENYQHRPLDTSTSEIRLVRIEKNPDSDATDPVKLTLRHAFLDGTEKFTTFNALSYAWGDDPASHEVVVYDGQSTGKLLVRNNLHDFLRVVERCADEWSSQWIFIDQICIDQNHLKEKCHQVGQMGKLYSSALATIVWPQSEPNAKRNPEYGGWEDHLFDNQDSGIACKLARRSRTNVSRANAIVAFFKLQPVGWTCDFLSRSYWWRSWVLQELILAPMVCILMPDGLWTIEDLALEIGIIVNHLKHSTPSHASSELTVFYQACKFGIRLSGICRLRRNRSTKSKSGEDSDPENVIPTTQQFHGWHTVLLLAKDSKSTYPHDRIYGLMGLVREDMRFDVDYELTPVDLIRILQFYRTVKPWGRSRTQIIEVWYNIFQATLNELGFDRNHLEVKAFKENLCREVEDYEVARPRAVLEKQLEHLRMNQRAVSL